VTAIRLSHETSDDLVVITVAGSVDFRTAPQLRELARSITEENIAPLVIDLDGVTFLDNVGVGVLVGAMKRQEARGSQFAIACTAEPVLRVLRTMGLLGRMGVRGSVDEAGVRP